jgi:hypothetical protein
MSDLYFLVLIVASLICDAFRNEWRSCTCIYMHARCESRHKPTNERCDRHFGHEHRRLGVDVPDLAVPPRKDLHSTAPGISGKKRTAMVTPIQVTLSQITQHDLVFSVTRL